MVQAGSVNEILSLIPCLDVFGVHNRNLNYKRYTFILM